MTAEKLGAFLWDFLIGIAFLITAWKAPRGFFWGSERVTRASYWVFGIFLVLVALWTLFSP